MVDGMIQADTDLAGAYLRRVVTEIQALEAQLPAIRRAGELLAESWRRGGMLWIAQTNHILFGELVARAAGPVAAEMLDHGGLHDPVVDLVNVEPRDILLIHTNTGNGPKTDVMVDLARERGCKVIALTQLVHARDGRLQATGSSGEFLADRADVNVDIGGVFGDGVIETSGVDVPICPLSGATGLPAAWAILAHAAEVLANDGFRPHFLLSGPLPGAKEVNAKTYAEWEALRAGHSPEV